MADTTREPHPADELSTVRDWLRYAVTRFEAAGLAYGHGTANAIDEAAFLILTLLHLPIDDAGPWLDCRLTRAERLRLHEVINQRITTRKPAPYLVRQAWIGAHKFYVDERVIVPRSFIGELLVRGQIAGILPAPDEVEHVLELCTGSGCLAILAGLAFEQADITACDISNDALNVASINVKTYSLESRLHLLHSNLFDAIPRRRFDLIIANPPYVTQEAVDAFAPEYRAEPQLAHLGGMDGLDLVHRILAQARDFLTDDGVLVVEIGQAREALEAARPDLPFLWLDTETSEGEVFALTSEDLSASTRADEKTAKRKIKSSAGAKR